MSLPPLLKACLPGDYAALIENAQGNGDFQLLEQRLNEAIKTDSHMLPGVTQGTRYYKPWAQVVVPKIVSALREAGQSSTYPEIKVEFAELDAKRLELGINAFGSPQDVLYAFCSERYAKWGRTMNAMFFRSACMAGKQAAVVTMADRYLSVETPDKTITELKGTISNSFWDSVQILFRKAACQQKLRDLAWELHLPLAGELDRPTPSTAQNIIEFMNDMNHDIPLAYREYLELLRPLLNEIVQKEAHERIRLVKKMFRRTRTKIEPEQIAQKYLEEGNFLQKLFDGIRVEHIQSNVKMVPNPLRGNKCEIDSIYRAVGEKQILLVEAKGKPMVSKTQLYVMYETYRLRLPHDWKVDVVAVLRKQPTTQQMQEGITAIIDVVKVRFEDSCLGRITESLLRMKSERAYRWEITA
jgi:hypothetical protein